MAETLIEAAGDDQHLYYLVRPSTGEADELLQQSLKAHVNLPTGLSRPSPRAGTSPRRSTTRQAPSPHTAGNRGGTSGTHGGAGKPASSPRETARGPSSENHALRPSSTPPPAPSVANRLRHFERDRAILEQLRQEIEGLQTRLQDMASKYVYSSSAVGVPLSCFLTIWKSRVTSLSVTSTEYQSAIASLETTARQLRPEYELKVQRYDALYDKLHNEREALQKLMPDSNLLHWAWRPSRPEI
ncbi:uncharacterized protein MONBRDRAFT_7988 [Monosiga brevicollis MX1]|uniref:Uncharacterized protein n=1 Tax=Monosiga brevicollis TaxID=81824 RepID=A9UYP8_MONBE|nr:uncharacterized protein MONBRDRAFT_7988 [Monosiga brevicollis MX1]EDQ89642.1 predicted protein [Monosiga brevicollis MX1]|eukprot:XP_001745671.1 hypothetical protein [Monosiga brevicollis MX1]